MTFVSFVSFMVWNVSEFRRHKEVTNKVHIIGFLSQWKMYLDELPKGPEADDFTGRKLDPTILEKVNNLLTMTCGSI